MPDLDALPFIAGLVTSFLFGVGFDHFARWVNLGLSEKSKSSISDYENGETLASQSTLRRLAEWYGVLLRVFMEPDPTAEEMIEADRRACARCHTTRARGRGREGGASPRR